MAISLLSVELKKMVFDTKDSVPGLGNVPVLGNLFKGQRKVIAWMSY